MFRKLTAVAALAAVLATSGCWYGTFMGPRATGVGKMRVRGIANFPAYVNNTDRDQDNEEIGPDELTPGFGGYFAKAMLTYGAGPRFDIGLQGNLYSAGIHAKWWAAMRPESKHRGMDFSPILFLDYIFETQRIAPKLSLVGGIPMSRIGQAYIGYEGFYGPDMTLIDDVYRGKTDFKKLKQEDYQDNVFIGADVNFQDFGLTIEIGYPIRRNDLDYSSTIWFGAGLWWGSIVKGLI